MSSPLNNPQVGRLVRPLSLESDGRGVHPALFNGLKDRIRSHRGYVDLKFEEETFGRAFRQGRETRAELERSAPPEIDEAHREEAEADDGVHVEEGDVDAGQIVGPHQRVFVEE